MRVAELIAWLEETKEKEGDLEVCIYDYHKGYAPIEVSVIKLADGKIVEVVG